MTDIVTITWEELREECNRLRALNAELLAALQVIADDPGGFPAEDVIDDMRKTAHTAIAKVEGVNPFPLSGNETPDA